ncbi:MAG: putative manganese-dependent inorganic diphosphatase [Clostridia bacterium]|nr:putative manganese-dependent inorganic diphosphatase [Clostridia bacterium]
MNEVFVTGHRNPDTDSIVAAISYANLRHALGDGNYIPARIGEINDDTRKLLERFGFADPMLLLDMRTQVSDLDFDRPTALSASVTIEHAWNIMRENGLGSVPIANEDGTLYGILSMGDVSEYDISTLNDNRIERIPLFNLISAVQGTLVNEFTLDIRPISGEVVLAMPQSYDEPKTGANCVLVCGDQPEIIDRAIQDGVGCIIICRAALKKEWAECRDTAIIATPLSAARVMRIIYQAAPVERICHTNDLVSFHLTDHIDDVREIMLKSRFRNYPILDKDEKVVGMLARFHLLRPRRKQVVLVDHNEVAQSVSGLEQVDVLEIIDHHRLADIQTAQPIKVRNEPVGSTNTIIASMYQENAVMPSKNMAGLMAGAILSDTVLFKSPTCTKRDISMAERLAKIAGISLEELGASLFSSNLDKPADELFRTDYKEFHISGHNIAVSQITCDASDKLLERKDEFLSIMERIKNERSFETVLLMITDVLLEGSRIVYVGSDDDIRRAFSVEPKGNTFFLPGIMSRKKQIIPMLTALWG